MGSLYFLLPFLSQLVRVADLAGRRSLCSSRTSRLRIPSVRLSTVGGRAFSVWTNHLEQPPRQRDFSSVSADLSSASENFLFRLPVIFLDNSYRVTFINVNGF